MLSSMETLVTLVVCIDLLAWVPPASARSLTLADKGAARCVPERSCRRLVTTKSCPGYCSRRSRALCGSGATSPRAQ